MANRTQDTDLVHIEAGGVELEGDLGLPEGSQGIVVFAHGSGSSRFSPRNQFVAEQLQSRGLATLLFDLLTSEEEEIDLRTRELRFDISLLANRVIDATDWLVRQPYAENLAIGYFGSSTGAAAALFAAAQRRGVVQAVASRGGRPDLAAPALPEVTAPTLLIVGGNDQPVIHMNRQAMAQMQTEVKLEIVPGAGHLFEEPGKLERVAELAGDWFTQYLT